MVMRAQTAPHQNTLCILSGVKLLLHPSERLRPSVYGLPAHPTARPKSRPPLQPIGYARVLYDGAAPCDLALFAARPAGVCV